MNLSLVALIPFAGAIFVASISRLGRLHAAWGAGFVTLLALAILYPMIADVFSGQIIIQRFSWIPVRGLDVVFRLDGLGLLFSLMILGIGLLIILYARYYLSERDDMGRFFAYLLMFMGSMLGIVISENIIQLLIFWELTSLSSFLLISYWQHRQESRSGARMALAVTGGGGLALLGGFLLLGEICNSYDLSVILISGDSIRAHALYLPMLILVLLGAFTKSAQFPFHFWLPNAMAAPTPVSAYLHSATMVKAGVFLLARLFPALSGTSEWFWLVSMTGLITLLVAAYIAMFKHDLKGLLAYSTISHLGLITLLFGMGTPLAAVAGVFHIINHAIFKASLFMAAGIIDHEAGTRDMRRLRGLWKFMPHTALLAMVAAASMAGVPLFNGFLSKEMFFAETLHHTHQPWGWLMPAAATLAGIFAVAYSLRFIHTVFFNGEPVDLPKTPHEPPRWMKVPVEILVALCLLVGMLPALTVEPILAVAAAGVLQDSVPEHDLAIWHGFNPALWMSVIALCGGILIYLVRRPLSAWYEKIGDRLEFRALYNYMLDQLFKIARYITHLLNAHSLQQMLFVFMLFILALGVTGFIDNASALTGDRARLPIDGVSILVTLILIIAAIGVVVLHRQRLVALILMGVVGLGVSLVFIKFSAPDLALTQLSVEVVTIVLMLLALYFLPQFSPQESGNHIRSRDALVATAAGLGVSLLVWAILTRPYHSIADYFLNNSVPGGGGTNVVNVILVDFRGYDTLGEITVLALAGLGVYAMLHQLKLSGSEQDNQGRIWDRDLHPVIMASFARLLLPLALLVSMYILLRGHNLPGGGFIAGLITAVALIMQYLANGVAWAHARLSVNMHHVIGAGIFIAVLTGVASWLFDHPFLTSTFSHLHWPIIGEFELASAMIFDLGVYLVVVGTTLLILIYLGLVHKESHLTNVRKRIR
ncbi:monovalent cation/H+ antiporter subunit A [Nitrosomonas ureae]|uniref:Multisubunit potassium/proton antiporter, PhaA subunit /multisubunit potassium/proton antiporter, PhaB subunit n=1 Tax=Nitrosomonas ureae TaxID=44577 RepID=A0A1H5V7T2_9PROT|nr:monovalent cation/H+ antiporter subunit A [Nitrosomonas ureae]SEF83244.1 multisubunit potassium/proton antiporter, PhaA subunit /multisubunit potassium/proton antiporter, PhaB subunit [Nitrosomonas ureae]